MPAPFLTQLTTPVAEKTTARITATITDDAATALPAASLTTLTLLLYDKLSSGVLNSRNRVSILNTNGGTVSVGGALTLTLTPADNTLVRQDRRAETHVALIEWTYNSGAAAGKALIEFVVQDFTQVS